MKVKFGQTPTMAATPPPAAPAAAAPTPPTPAATLPNAFVPAPVKQVAQSEIVSSVPVDAKPVNAAPPAPPSPPPKSPEQIKYEADLAAWQAAQTAAIAAVQVPPPAVPASVVPAGNVQAAPVKVTTEGNLAVATVPAQTLPAVPNNRAFFDDDNIDPQDLVIPRLNIVQKVGELSNMFEGGALVLNQQLVISDGPPAGQLNVESKPITLLVRGFRPIQFAEKVEGGERGNIFNTEAEVAAAGGTTSYDIAEATGQPLYQRLATALCVIERPEGLDNVMFPHQLIENGVTKDYALALWSMKGTAYTNAAKIIKSAKKIGHLRKEGYVAAWWSVATKMKQFKGNFAYCPVLRPTLFSTPAFRAFLKDLLGE